MENRNMISIVDVAKKINLTADDLELYGNYKAKIKRINKKEQGEIILVTATNPTPFGEGKTTVSIGLNDALRKLGYNSICSLREPSMGPVFGIKGGATGGGLAQVVPSEDINLHFTGDFHAITSANNLISAIIDNSIKQGNKLNLDVNAISFKRCLDMNDRALREIQISLGAKINGSPRSENFNITAASEIMAIFCLAKDMNDLRRRINKIIIGKNMNGEDVFVEDLKITGSILALLKDAINPNLVQTLEQNPVIIHGGPFANIAHGCSSIIATKTCQQVADYVIEEAGFGADLGALKFYDIKCKKNNLSPLGAVLITTLRALKYNGGATVELAKQKNQQSLKKGLPNLEVHIENLLKFNKNLVVTLNKFADDTEEEIAIVREFVEKNNIPFCINDVFAKGGKGALNLSHEILKWEKTSTNEIYSESDDLKLKIEKVCKDIYRAIDVEYSGVALEKIDAINQSYKKYPICIAKTQYSISDNKDALGKPTNHIMKIRDIVVYNGAEFITVLMGDIMTMPGLGKQPAALSIDIDENNNITGIF